MNYQSVQIWEGTLAENALNYSAFFSSADFIYCTYPDRPDWSQSGDFVAIDGDLLITVAPGVKRRIDLFSFLSSREVVRIPEEFSRSNFLMEVVLQASFPVNVSLFAVSPVVPLDDRIEQIYEAINTIIPLLNDLVLPTGELFTSLPPGI